MAALVHGDHDDLVCAFLCCAFSSVQNTDETGAALMIDRELLCQRLQEAFLKNPQGDGPKCCGAPAMFVSFRPHDVADDKLIITWQCVSCGTLHEKDAVAEPQKVEQ